nr:hypothetical protein [Tanacetum cinerariifolium]
MQKGDSSVTTLVSAKMISEGTKVSVDATKTPSDVNISGLTSRVGATNVIVNMAMEKQSSLVDTTGLGSYPSLPKHVATPAANAPGKSSYTNVTGKPSGKKLNFCTLFTPGGNEIDVVVLMYYIRTISERFANTLYGYFLGKRVAYHVVANYLHGRDECYAQECEDGLSAISTKLGARGMCRIRELKNEDLRFVHCCACVHTTHEEDSVGSALPNVTQDYALVSHSDHKNPLDPPNMSSSPHETIEYEGCFHQDSCNKISGSTIDYGENERVNIEENSFHTKDKLERQSRERK